MFTTRDEGKCWGRARGGGGGGGGGGDGQWNLPQETRVGGQGGKHRLGRERNELQSPHNGCRNPPWNQAIL